MSNVEVNEYEAALRAGDHAVSVIRWAQPLRTLGWVLVGGAGFILLLGIISAMVAASQGTGNAAMSILFSAIVVSVAALVQGALVLVLTSYLLMRAEWTSFRIGRELADD
ncbi:MAG: hypothetical protein Q8L05_02320 [Actinomycetota bacterium]|nr:hypothetical protein [Actinomycetota bacterium]MDP2288729.1 hypothetical protein [Actinomycetota bacterium]